MNFSEALERYIQLKKMLENKQIAQEEYDRQAGELRVLGPDNAWWQIRASDGVWFRWNGQAWSQIDPPESSFDRPTELAFLVDSVSANPQDAVEQISRRLTPQEQSPGSAKPSSQAASKPNTVLRIMRGQPALEVLLQAQMIREIYTGIGKRYQVVNPRPTGIIRGIAFHITSDGYLDPDVAVEAEFSNSMHAGISSHGSSHNASYGVAEGNSGAASPIAQTPQSIQCLACQATNIGSHQNCLLCANSLVRLAVVVPEAPTALNSTPGMCLLALSGEFAGQRFPLGEFTRIGRSLENSITLSDAQVSRKHAAIQKIGPIFMVMDHGSANGTFVNEKRVSDRAHLRPGDVIRIGNTRLRVELV